MCSLVSQVKWEVGRRGQRAGLMLGGGVYLACLAALFDQLRLLRAGLILLQR